MKYFVFYSDDYPDNGGVGLKECETVEAAESFIEQRMKVVKHNNLAHYKVIIGATVELTTVDKITKVKIEDWSLKHEERNNMKKDCKCGYNPNKPIGKCISGGEKITKVKINEYATH